MYPPVTNFTWGCDLNHSQAGLLCLVLRQLNL